MSSISRIRKLEAKARPARQPRIVVKIEPITDEIRQAQREALARGEKFFIVEPLEKARAE